MHREARTARSRRTDWIGTVTTFDTVPMVMVAAAAMRDFRRSSVLVPSSSTTVV